MVQPLIPNKNISPWEHRKPWHGKTMVAPRAGKQWLNHG